MRSRGIHFMTDHVETNTFTPFRKHSHSLIYTKLTHSIFFTYPCFIRYTFSKFDFIFFWRGFLGLGWGL